MGLLPLSWVFFLFIIFFFLLRNIYIHRSIYLCLFVGGWCGVVWLLMMLLFPGSCSSFNHDHMGRGLLMRMVLVLVLVLFPCASTTAAACNSEDKDSLLLFANNFPSSSINWSAANGQGEDCCLWDGISCDDQGHRVVGISLPNKGLTTPWTTNYYAPLENLTSLSFLNLSCNFLSGPLPPLLQSFNHLRTVDFSYNQLSGNLPQPSTTTTISTLNLSSNYLNGTIPPSFFPSFPSLIALNVSNNTLTGHVPTSTICNPPNSNLIILDLSLNDFTGDFPPFLGPCSALQVLSMGFNNLTGALPPVHVSTTPSLRHLSFPGNSLTGPIPDSITTLANLTTLALFGNNFTGPIPHAIGNLPLLHKLELHINRLNGSLPPSLVNCKSLQLLNLRVNSFTGNLSDFNFSGFTRLTILDLGENRFSGELPATIFSCKSLTAIRLATNRLRGEIHSDVLRLPSLSFLSLSNNTLRNITNAFHILSSHPKLTTLILSKNFFNETLPTQRISGFSNLKIMGLGGCKLFGQIPTWLSSLTNLEVIDLSQNNIHGIIPAWLHTLSNLFYLDLSNNSLSGGFPVELTRLPALASQQVLDRVNSSYLELPVFVAPQNASYLQYNQLANLPPALYLSSNQLGGSLPVEIGNMQSIHTLDLKLNNFSGAIPATISNLTNLEKLDLSHNNLSGQIPASLKSLYFLSSFDVAYNKLQGSIPTGGQFDTFLNQTYEGNPGLCGPPTQNLCPDENNPRSPKTDASSPHEKGPNKKLIVGLILGICFGVGITLACLALWILSKRRILPRGDPEVFHMDTVSFNSTSAVEVPKDTSGVILFPQNAKDIKHLTITDILKATEDFSQANIIGCGGFGLVYKATLANGTKVAVKKLSGDMGLIAREFKAEVEALSTANHKNLVSLQGYCVHDGCQLLIYSYMENGSLDYWLHEKADGASRLDWPTRLKIAQGASCGLAYMHQVCEPHIVHRDIKSSNILLDDQFEAYVADFGLSRLIHPYNTHVTTELVGTLGYIPPEYSQSWIATLRGDIYSFGVVMLELLTGKRPMEVFRPKASRELVVWVQQLRIEGKQDQIFDEILRDKGFEEEMLQVLDVACMCVNVNPVKRPTINEVVDWLHNVGPNHQIPK